MDQDQDKYAVLMVPSKLPTPFSFFLIHLSVEKKHILEIGGFVIHDSFSPALVV